MDSVKVESLEPRVIGAVRLGSYENCVIHVWSGKFGMPEVDALNAYTAKVAEARPEGIAILALVEAGTPMPTSEGRRMLEEYFVHFAERTRAVAHVAEGKGPWAGMARSVMTALQLMRRRSYPTKVFSAGDDGIAWLSPFISADGSKDGCEGLTRCLTEVRGIG